MTDTPGERTMVVLMMYQVRMKRILIQYLLYPISRVTFLLNSRLDINIITPWLMLPIFNTRAP